MNRRSHHIPSGLGFAALAGCALALAACEVQESGNDANSAANGSAAASGNDSAPSASPPAAAPATDKGGTQGAQRWDLQSSGEGAALVFLSGSGPSIRLFCAAANDSLLVNVPSFRPIGSEERLSFGGGGDVVALVADTRGDRQRGGVSGTGDVPANLAALLAGPVSASYGSQRSGPHAAPRPDLARSFVAACAEKSPDAPAKLPAGPPAASGHPCLMQGNARLNVPPYRAVGTEPFWGARITGRCVTYSHPDDQAGTRVWTRYTARGDGGSWAGSLGGRPFALTLARGTCSDGMSDRTYPYRATLQVNGETRRGCADTK